MRASVIIPAYNATRTIQTCLRALLAQTYPSEWYEIIVVDDGSTDGTGQLAEDWTREYRRTASPGTAPSGSDAAYSRVNGSVRVVRASHRGAAAARNCGAREARGEILLFTDADCEPTESWIEEMLAPFNQGADEVVGAKGTYRTRQREVIARFVQLEYEEKYARMSRARYVDFVDTYSAAYRRDVFLANGGFDESFPSASVEDQELSFRLARQGCRMVFAPGAIVYHQHVKRLRAYALRKFRIGYWKVHLHRYHSDKVWTDTHTPPTLKLQVACVLAAVGSLFAMPFVPAAWVLTFLSLLFMVVSSIPLTVFIARRDRAIVIVTPAMILTRAAALGAGLVAGAWGEIWRSGGVRRGFDILGAVIGLVFSVPFWPLLALAVKLDSAGPVMFTQLRAGKDGHPFRIFKFRSMVDGAEGMLDRVIAQSCLPPPVYKIPNDPRVTRVGRFLRRFSLDELPQFINVLRGEMSLVGPRPEELRIVALYQEWHRQRLTVKPGITGPMQVNGRGALSLDKRVRLELDYIERRNLWNDLRLLAQTVPAMIGGRGAY